MADLVEEVASTIKAQIGLGLTHFDERPVARAVLARLRELGVEIPAQYDRSSESR